MGYDATVWYNWKENECVFHMAENGNKYEAQIEQASQDAQKNLEEIDKQIEAILATVKDEVSDQSTQ